MVSILRTHYEQLHPASLKAAFTAASRANLAAISVYKLCHQKYTPPCQRQNSHQPPPP